MAVATLVRPVQDRFTQLTDNPSLLCDLAPRRLPVLRRPASAGVPVPGLKRNIQVKLANNFHEWEEAFQLVADNYQARGYEMDDADYRFTSYHALPDTVVLVAKEADRVVATFSLVADNTLLGLPLEDLYRGEILELRRQGRHIFETTCLADRDLGMREFVQVFLALIRLAWQYGVGHGGNTNVITVNPRHVDFYTKMLGYVPLGTRKTYGKVNGHPAEAFYLDPELMRARVPQVYERIFGERLPGRLLLPARMSEKQVRFFARHSSQANPRAVEQVLWHAAQTESLRRW